MRLQLALGTISFTWLYLTAIAPSCDRCPIGEQWETFNIAIAFPPDVPIDLPADGCTAWQYTALAGAKQTTIE